MIIHNGDHAEFEMKHANTPPHERPDWPLPSFDARDWAKAFCSRFGGDEELMTAWFANALMRGYDERASRAMPKFHACCGFPINGSHNASCTFYGERECSAG